VVNKNVNSRVNLIAVGAFHHVYFVILYGSGVSGVGQKPGRSPWVALTNLYVILKHTFKQKFTFFFIRTSKF